MKRYMALVAIVELPDDTEAPTFDALHNVLVSTGGTVIDHAGTVVDDYEDASEWIGEIL